MTSYGFPDWQTTLTQQAQPLVAVDGHTAAPATTYGPFFVGMHAGLGVFFRDQGVSTGYTLVFDWHADQAGSQVVREFSYIIPGDQFLRDVVGNSGPWLTVTVTALASGAGQQYQLFLIPYLDRIDKRDVLAGEIGVAFTVNPLGAGATFQAASQRTARCSAFLHVRGSTNQWNASVYTLDWGGALGQFVAGCAGGGQFLINGCQLELPGQGVAVLVTNQDVAGKAFDISLVLQG